MNHPSGASRRRGPFRAGERVQLTDVKGRKYTTMLTREGYFQSARGSLRHSEIIGRDEGSVIETPDGHRLLALRPLLDDYILSMPRGAAVIYPKDAAQIIHAADIFPGARVLEAGLGSGALTLSLLAATGPDGLVTSVEQREDFARIATRNVESWYGEEIPPWRVELGDVADVLADLDDASLDHVILDMLDPWEHVGQAARVLRPGGVIVAYVATTTQMSRFVEDLRATFSFTEARATESQVRTWHLEGLAVRPDHRMVAHTGFLIIARRLAPGSEPLLEKRRPAKLAYSQPMPWDAPGAEHPAPRTISPKKLRRVLRDVDQRAHIERTGTAHRTPNAVEDEAKCTNPKGGRSATAPVDEAAARPAGDCAARREDETRAARGGLGGDEGADEHPSTHSEN